MDFVVWILEVALKFAMGILVTSLTLNDALTRDAATKNFKVNFQQKQPSFTNCIGE